MLDTPFNPINLIIDGYPIASPVTPCLQDERWTSVLEQACDFDALLFDQVSYNLIRNPNINSTHLFRADILYDSSKDGTKTKDCSPEEAERMLREYTLDSKLTSGFEITRTIIRLMVPRNPQLDRPIAQTCYFLHSTGLDAVERCLVVYVPHVSVPEDLPWYHPTVQYLAYLHTWHPEPVGESAPGGQLPLPDSHQGKISIHFCLFPSQSFPLPSRLLRTAFHLLSTLHKHGQGCRSGYTKRVHHDRLISQSRVQDTYTELKQKYAKRLCDSWVEQTDPSKHVFEDLGIAAFLIELWKDMYQPPETTKFSSSLESYGTLPPFPGFVDIGCGNGVLTEILLLSGYHGWGFDARRRKTWSILSSNTQAALRELILVPSPLFGLHRQTARPASRRSRALSFFLPSHSSSLKPPSKPWHDGIFSDGTFIISNHADELTPWTPLLASLSQSPFLAIPCCSHNLSGLRFRAPTVFNSQSADHLAPTFFANNVTKSKGIAISIAAYVNPEVEEDDDGTRAFECCGTYAPSATDSDETLGSASTPGSDRLHHDSPTRPKSEPVTSHPPNALNRPPSSGDLRSLTPAARAKQPSAYSSLCDWVSHLAAEVGYIPEREVLRIPSTRNVGIIGRAWTPDLGNEQNPKNTSVKNNCRQRCHSLDRGLSGTPPSPFRSLAVSEQPSKEHRGRFRSARPLSDGRPGGTLELDREARMERVIAIARREGADGSVLIARCAALGKGKGLEHV
ncbi:tRNA(Ser) Um(44) 2'-O-methyltransferase [Lambiella insularis]|nr:tRNA(Ser) Um(44) 2'-O-methyltransferase [Lambiella insularis]